MLNFAGSILGRKTTQQPAGRKDVMTLLTLLAGAAVVTEWLSDRGSGGWVARAIEWLTDEQVRVEAQIGALEDELAMVDEGTARYYDISAQISNLEVRLAQIEEASNDTK